MTCAFSIQQFLCPRKLILRRKIFLAWRSFAAVKSDQRRILAIGCLKHEHVLARSAIAHWMLYLLDKRILTIYKALASKWMGLHCTAWHWSLWRRTQYKMKSVQSKLCKFPLGKCACPHLLMQLLECNVHDAYFNKLWRLYKYRVKPPQRLQDIMGSIKKKDSAHGTRVATA